MSATDLALIVHALGWALIHGLWQGLAIAAIVRVALAVTQAPRVRASWAWAGSLAIALAFVATARFELERARALIELGPAPAVGQSPSLIEQLLPAVVLAWAVGLTLFGLRAGLGFAGVARLRATARAVDANIERLCEALARSLGVGERVGIAWSDRIDMPVAIGWLRPMVLLPLGLASRLDGVALEAAIAHELAHVRRHDYLLNAILTAVEAAMFHHPAVWWLGGVVRREREHACDDLVVAHVQSRRAYARSLLTLEQLRAALDPSAPALDPAAPALAADGAPLLTRIRRLMESPMPVSTSKLSPQTFLPRALPLLIAGLGLSLALALPACLEPDEGPTDEPGELIDGTIAPGDEAAALAIAWLPEAVVALAPNIEAAARRHGIHPDLLAIVVLVESGGDPRAESPTGARGLMQLMPTTAEHIAAERSIAAHDVEQLWDPDRNLDYGAYHLARLLEHWGDVELAAAAYNGGTKTVERWTAGETELSAETAEYKRVVARLWAARAELDPPR